MILLLIQKIDHNKLSDLKSFFNIIPYNKYYSDDFYKIFSSKDYISSINDIMIKYNKTRIYYHEIFGGDIMMNMYTYSKNKLNYHKISKLLI